MDFSRIKYLIERYNAGELSKEEWSEFRSALSNEHFFTALSDDLAHTFAEIKSGETAESNERSRVFPLLVKKWMWYAAAAVLIAISGVLYFSTDRKQTLPAVADTRTEVPLKHDIAPGANRAMLTLSDGTVIYLDSATAGMLAHEGSSVIRKTADGRIVYSPENAADAGKVMYNSMSTPRGGQYTLVLPDGSKVWLNAASSITYPTTFSGEERTVSITGEVYFEVQKDAGRPFIVKTIHESIKVLGTHFNVNAYADEAFVKTSLLEGRVMVNQEVLQPGQAYYNGKVVPTNIAQDIAWKNGVFDFDDVEFAVAIRQLSRWYNLDVQYDTDIPKIRFGGKIDRNLNLSQVLKVIDGVGAHFELNGRVLHIIR
ncbi:MAG: FecR family protein [Chitinophagaceae bacterium]|nr:FecR family protein [Chitinophagaceae bacterium]